MQLGYTILYVENVEQTLAFYNQAFQLPTKMLHESGLYGELETGQTTLAFAHFSERPSGITFADLTTSTPSCEIVLTTVNVEHCYQHALHNGAMALKAPMDTPWGQVVAYVRDLNGYLVEIATPVTG